MAEQAQEMVVDATPKKKAFMDKRSTHEDIIKKDEEVKTDLNQINAIIKSNPTIQKMSSTIENNAKVKLALEKLEESKELVIYSSRENLPSITGTVTGTYESADTDTASTSTTPETFTDSYKLVISKNIYDAGVNKLEIERSKILYNNELVNFESTIENLILDAIEGYLTVINYEKSLEATKKNFDVVIKNNTNFFHVSYKAKSWVWQ